MNGLLGFVLFSAAATAYSMDTPTNTTMLDFEKLSTIVNTAKAFNQEKCINCGLNPLIIAICKSELEKVMDIYPNFILNSVEGLFPIHWAIIAKQNDIYDQLAKDQRNVKDTLGGLTTFDLQVRFDAWNKEQIKERESKDHFCDTLDNWKSK